MIRLLAAALVAVFSCQALALGAGPKMCLQRDDTAKYLEQSHNEHFHGIGISEGVTVQLFATDDGATWTQLWVLPNGCIVGFLSGESWMEPPRKKGDPA